MILERIVNDTRQRLERQKAEIPLPMLERQISESPDPIDFVSGLRQPGVGIIAEIKRASPSRGPLDLGLNPAQLALTYAQAGCEAISILTEPLHFKGCADDLRLVRRSLDAEGLSRPLLRKDFIIDRYQLFETRSWGADAVLLIVAVLEDALLCDLFAVAQQLGLTPLVEVHDRQDLDRALTLNPPIIGINNRNLHDFSVDLETTRSLRPLIPKDCIVVSESGIREEGQMRELADLGVDAALIGESLVTGPDPAAKLRALKRAGGRQ